MMTPDFEWADVKARANLRKHGVTFDEAKTVFADSLASIFIDEKHSDVELREIIIGHSSLGRLIVVCFTERRGPSIRIISARKASARERRKHEEAAKR